MLRALRRAYRSIALEMDPSCIDTAQGSACRRPGVWITLNGAPREIAPGTTIADLVRILGLRAELVAVEVNGELVARGEQRATVIAERDAVELVTLVGGG